MPKSRMHARSQAEFLKRLAIVFSDPLRLKIVIELYIREMSPSQFYKAFGGGSVTRVNRHFKKLADHGWLRMVSTESGGRRRGATEHFYRATELAIFDQETWPELPYALRVAFSWTTFEQLAVRVRDALEAETFDGRPDRHLTWTPLLLDECGWTRTIAAVDALFESLAELQAEAKLRIAKSGEMSVLTTVALGAFESPTLSPDAERATRSTEPDAWSVSAARGAASSLPATTRLAKVFSDSLNLKIITKLNMRAMSPSQFSAEFGDASVTDLDRRFKMLVDIGWLEKSDEKTGGKRRGATEHFYRATGPAIFDDRSWTEVPESIKAEFSWRTFQQLAEQFTEAVDAGTLDARPDRHLTWSLLMLDEIGWKQVIAALDALFESLAVEEKEARQRLAESGETSIATIVALAAFESPKDRLKAP